MKAGAARKGAALKEKTMTMLTDQNTIALSRSATESIAEGDAGLLAYYKNRAEERLNALIPPGALRECR